MPLAPSSSSERCRSSSGAVRNRTLDSSELVELLQVRGAEQEALFAEARRVRDEAIGPGVVVRGVVELTNACRVNCEYCPMRRDNGRSNTLFRLTADEIVRAAQEIRSAGIDVVFLQAGEVPQTTALVAEVLPRIRELFGGTVEILLNLGNKTRAEYAELRERGATSYILKHETSDPMLHLQMRHESLETRLRCLRDLLDLEYKVGTGAIVGLPGQSLASLAEDLLLARRLGVAMSSASPFVPAPGTPLAAHPAAQVETTLNLIALTRILGPDLLIPSVSALERAMSRGQTRGLNAGANVMTVNFSQPAHREEYLIYGRGRYVVGLRHVERTVAAAGLDRVGSPFVPVGSS